MSLRTSCVSLSAVTPGTGVNNRKSPFLCHATDIVYLYALIPIHPVQYTRPVSTNEMKSSEEGDSTEPDAQHSFLDYAFPCRAIPPSQHSRLRVTMLLMVFQQLTGINAILYFAESVCLFAGLSWASTCALTLGIFQIIFTLIAAPIVHRVPRRKVLMWTAIVMAVAHLLHGIFFLVSSFFSLICT